MILSFLLCQFPFYLISLVCANSFYLQHVGNHSLIPPFDVESGLTGFNPFGDFQLKKHALVLNPNSDYSSIWSKNPINTKHWHMQLVFRHQTMPSTLEKEEEKSNSGLVFWTIDPKSLQTNLDNHELHGGPSKFKGIAISFDDDDRVSLIVNDGTRPFKNPGEKSIKGGMIYGSCRRAWRNNALPLYVRIQYFMTSLKVDIDNDDEGQSFTPCIEIRDVHVGEDYVTGFSANMDEVELLIMRLGVFLKASSLEDMRQKLLSSSSQDKNTFQDNLALVSKELEESFTHKDKDKREFSNSDDEKGKHVPNLTQDEMLNYLFRDLKEEQTQIKKLLDGEKELKGQLKNELENIQNQLNQLFNNNKININSGDSSQMGKSKNEQDYMTRSSSFTGSRIFYISILSIQLFLLISFLIAKRHLNGGRIKKYM